MFNVLVCDISITVPIFTAFVWTFFSKNEAEILQANRELVSHTAYSVQYK